MSLLSLTVVVMVVTTSVAAADQQPITVTSIVEAPYLQLKTDSSSLEGNDRFEGYIIDLLQQLASNAAFTYNIKLVDDDTYGRRLDNGRWNGMIGEVIDNKADLAAAPITVSDERRSVIDFTDPFMSFGSAILMKKLSTADQSTTTHSSQQLPAISSISDLADQTTIKYGVIKDGRTADFFRRSKIPAYSRMWREMSNNEDYGLVPDTEDGVRRVRQSDGRYAFILEGTTASYWIHREPCDLITVPGNMDERTYALAVRHGSELKAKVDAGLKQMKDNGDLEKLRRKWWDDKSQCSGAVLGFLSTSSLVLVTAHCLLAAAAPRLL